MTQQQKDALKELISKAPLDIGGDVVEQRANFEKMLGARPLADDVSDAALARAAAFLDQHLSPYLPAPHTTRAHQATCLLPRNVGRERARSRPLLPRNARRLEDEARVVREFCSEPAGYQSSSAVDMAAEATKQLRRSILSLLVAQAARLRWAYANYRPWYGSPSRPGPVFTSGRCRGDDPVSRTVVVGGQRAIAGRGEP